MITGDHFHFDPGPQATLHGCYRFIPRRVNDSKQTKQGHFTCNIFHSDSLCITTRNGGNGQSPLPQTGNRLNLLPPVSRIERLVSILVAFMTAHIKNPFRCSFEVDDSLAARFLMQCGHKFVFGFKRDYVFSGQFRIASVRIQTSLERQGNQGAIRRISLYSPDLVIFRY